MLRKELDEMSSIWLVNSSMRTRFDLTAIATGSRGKTLFIRFHRGFLKTNSDFTFKV
jgi:hypothetical protein